MSSSLRAQVILGALWLVATLTMTSAQLRVLRAPASSRRRPYAVAWFAGTAIVGGLLAYLDRLTGRVGAADLLVALGLVAIVSALALAAGAVVESRGERAGPVRVVMLLLLHGVIVALAYPFI